MSLRFILGRAGSGKSYYCLNDMKKKLENKFDKQLILIVPEQFSFQAQKNLLDVVGEKCGSQAQVLDFKRMAYRILNDLGGITKEHLNSSGRAMLINYILNKNPESFTAFHNASKQSGFVDTIGDTIGELKKYDVTPEKLEDTIHKLPEENDLKRKLQDIYYIYTRYEKILHESFIDSNDDITILAEKLPDWDFLKGSEVWIDEFSDFNIQQYLVIEKLLKICKRVNISLCSDVTSGKFNDDIENIFSATAKTEGKLIKIIQENNIALDKAVVLNGNPNYKFRSSEEIWFLEQNLYSYPYEKYIKSTKDISIFVATNTYSEVENTARDIIRLCRDKGAKYSDIAVVTRDLSLYDSIISAIFTEYEIPFFIDKRKEIQNNLLVVFILSVFQIQNKNWSYEEVFRYLKTGLTGVSFEDIDLLENYVLSNGIRGKGKWLQKEKWCYLTDYCKTQDQIDRIDDIRKRVISPIEKLNEELSGRGNAARFSTALFNFLQDMNIIEKVNAMIEKFKNNGEVELASEYSQIWNLTMDLLNQMVEVMGDKELDTDEFIKLLQIGFSENKMGLIPPAIDQVLIGSVDRLKNHDVSIMYLLGVNDGIFPKTIDDEGILNDSDRAVLKENGIELARDTKTQAFQEQFLVYTTLTGASKYIKVSYPIADFQGKTLRPSIIISRLKTIFPKIYEESDVIQDESCERQLSYVSSKVPTFNHMITEFRNSADGNSCDDLWKDVYRWYASKKEWQDKTRNVISGMDYSNQMEQISDDRVRKIYGNNITMSTTKIETYVRCPFAYFVRYGLKVKKRDIHILTPPDLGRFMHEAIDKYCISVSKNQLRWDEISDDWRNNEINEIVENMIKQNESSIFNYSARYKYITQRLKRVLSRTMKVISKQITSGNFAPVGYEVEFGDKGSYPPIIIEMPWGEKINIVGKIDRIDMVENNGDTYIRVVDYKSGNKVFKLSDVYYGLQIQLLLYLDAILTNENISADKPVLPGGILYLKIDDPIIKEKENLTDEEIEKEILKTLKMRGLVLADPDIIREMDEGVGANSYIIPAGIKTDGEITISSSAATREQFNQLKSHVRKNLVRCCMDMLSGKIDIIPYKKDKETACDYCDYSSICQFDISIKQNNYKIISDKKDDEIWDLLRIESEGEEDNE